MTDTTTAAIDSRKLGKNLPRHDVRTLQLANYIDHDELAALPPLPKTRDWTTAFKGAYGMMGNDKYGCCTCAAAGHEEEIWTANAGASGAVGHTLIVSEADVLKAYTAVTGFDPADPSTDRGANMLDVLKYRRKVGIGGRKIGCFLALEPKNVQQVEMAINLGGSVYIGLALPKSAQTQKTWSVPPGGTRGGGAPNSWGGHCVNLAKFGPSNFWCITWGALQAMTHGFWTSYGDESYVCFSEDWVKPGAVAPCGINHDALLADLKTITS